MDRSDGISPALEIQQLRKLYPGSDMAALDGFSFQVRRNQIMGLLGPNGAGKTTCIHILCGLLQPDAGAIRIFGQDCSAYPDSIKRLIGVVPQQIALFDQLTAMENFQYFGRLYELSERLIAARSLELLHQLGLERHADKLIGRYSGGMKRRANIIASLLHQPELLILDEPTSGVDVQSRAMIHLFLKDYQGNGNTILYTSHNLDEAEKLCDEVVIIDEGKYITGGSPEELILQTEGCRRLEDVFLQYTGHPARD